MKIRVLGTRGEIDASAPQHRYHSGLLYIGFSSMLEREPGQVQINEEDLELVT